MLLAELVQRAFNERGGELWKRGRFWVLRWREDKQLPNGTLKHRWSRVVEIGWAEGLGRVTEWEARRMAYSNWLSRLDPNTPQSAITVRQFADRFFIPEHVAELTTGGQAHYASILRYALEGIPEERRCCSSKRAERGNWVKDDVERRFGIGQMRLCEVTYEDVQRLLREAIDRGYSFQTAKHIRNTIGAVFSYAEDIYWHSGPNPAESASLVRPPRSKDMPEADVTD